MKTKKYNTLSGYIILVKNVSNNFFELILINPFMTEAVII